LILKEQQCGNIGKQIESTLNCDWLDHHQQKKPQPFSTFPTLVLITTANFLREASEREAQGVGGEA